MHVPHDDAADAVAAAFLSDGLIEPGFSVLASVDGGRDVAAVRTALGRWAACNAYPGKACASPLGAERELARLLKRGRRGLLGQVPGWVGAA